jgi:hypothetical protein
MKVAAPFPNLNLFALGHAKSGPKSSQRHLTQIPKFGIVLVVVLVLGALGFRDRKETDSNLLC